MKNRKQNLEGQQFGRLTVLSFHEVRKGKTMWNCLCSCGTQTIQRADAMKSGISRSCGCYKKEQTVKNLQRETHKDLVGKKFSRLLVLSAGPKQKKKTVRWVCSCDCGSVVLVSGSSLVSGHTRSCGCLQRQQASKQATEMGASNKTHGKTATPEWMIWRGMRLRCYDTAQPAYPNYGGRGIKVCDRWTAFENFFADMGERPTEKHSLDRIDCDGDYTPTNCRWATNKQQQRNRRNNIRVEYNGEVKCLSEWAELYGLKQVIVWNRYVCSRWSIHRTLTIPLAKTTQQRLEYKKYRNERDLIS